MLRRSRPGDYLRFALWEAFQVAAAAQGGVRRMVAEVAGKVRGLLRLARESLR